MIVIPVQTVGGERGPIVLVLVLEKENLDRMRAGDPMDFQPRSLGRQFNTRRPIRELDIVVAYEEDLNPILEYQRSGDIHGLLVYLERGRKHQVGDATPPTPLRKS